MFMQTIIGILGLLVLLLVLARPRWGLYLLLPAVVFSPEFILGNVEFRRVSLRIEDLLFLGILGGLLLRGQMLQQALGSSRWVWPALAFMFVLGIATTIGLMTGSTVSIPLAFFFALKFVQYFFLAVCAAALVRTEEHLRGFVLALIVTMTALALWMLFPVFGANPDGPRITLPFDPGGTQQSAVFGAMAAVMCCSLLLHWRAMQPRFLTVGLLIGFFAGLGMLVASGGRAGAIGAAVALLYLGTTVFPLRLRARPLAIAAVFVLVAMTVVVRFHDDPRFQSGLNRITGVSSLEGIEGDTSLQARLTKWQTFLGHWQEHPVLGTGVPAVAWVDNWYLRLLIETGIAGLAVWLWLMWMLYRTMRAGVRRDGTLVSAYATGMIGVLTVMGVASIFAEYFMTIRTAVPFWVITGAGMGVVIRQRPAQSPEPAGRWPAKGTETFSLPAGR